MSQKDVEYLYGPVQLWTDLFENEQAYINEYALEPIAEVYRLGLGIESLPIKIRDYA